MLRRLCSLVILALISSVNAQESTSVPQLKTLLGGVKASLQKQGISAPQDHLAEMQTMPEFRAFEEEVAGGWKTALENLNEIATSTSDQFILFNALENLPAEDYVKSLNVDADLFAQGKLRKPVFLNNILFTSGTKWGFLAVNYQNPEVVQLLQKVKTLVPADAAVIKSIDNILSGQGKKTVEENIELNPDYRGRSIKALAMDAVTSKSNTATPSSNPKPAPSFEAPAAAKSSPISETKPTPAFPILPVVIVVGLLVGMAVVFLRRKSP